MVIDEDLLLTAVVRVIKAEKPAHAVDVRVELGEIADDGGVMDVAYAEIDAARHSQPERLK
ncbi:MAG TPA: hypothetical protein VK736_05350 [Candidatus Binatia bacterium]|nr:hypothetical protein [Candidatus Binatia bacterium]